MTTNMVSHFNNLHFYTRWRPQVEMFPSDDQVFSADFLRRLMAALKRLDKRTRRLQTELRRRSLENREFLTPKEAALLLRKRPFTCREYCRHGQLKAVRVGNRGGYPGRLRIPAEEVRRALDEGIPPRKRRSR